MTETECKLSPAQTCGRVQPVCRNLILPHYIYQQPNKETNNINYIVFMTLLTIEDYDMHVYFV